MSDTKGRSTEIVIQSILVIIAGFGVYFGKQALAEYHQANIESQKANMVMMMSKLDDREDRVYDRLKTSDSLNSFWAYPPGNVTSREWIDLRMAIFNKNSHVNGKNTTTSTASTFPTQWTHVSKLDEILYSYSSFTESKYEQLRDAYNFAEEMLYLADSAYYAYINGMITKEAWEGYRTYIVDTGSHPLFLEAVYWGHECGLYSKDFAILLRECYQTDSELKDAAKEIYPELVEEGNKWLLTKGQRQLSNQAMHTDGPPARR